MELFQKDDNGDYDARRLTDEARAIKSDPDDTDRELTIPLTRVARGKDIREALDIMFGQPQVQGVAFPTELDDTYEVRSTDGWWPVEQVMINGAYVTNSKGDHIFLSGDISVVARKRSTVTCTHPLGKRSQSVHEGQGDVPPHVHEVCDDCGEEGALKIGEVK